MNGIGRGTEVAGLNFQVTPSSQMLVKERLDVDMSE